MAVTQRTYVFKSDNGLSVTLLRGEEPPSITGGYGGWEVVDRPRRVGFTQWVGRDPFRMKVPALFDDWKAGSNIEGDIGLLERMAVQDAGGEPPLVDVIGAVPHKRIDKWVIESLEWGTNVIWGFDRHGVPVRFRQDVTVNLLQHVDPAIIKAPAKGAGKGKRPKPKHKWHVVKHGETLRKISAEEYGNQKWWRDIAKANNIRDPKKIHVGQKLRMP